MLILNLRQHYLIINWQPVSNLTNDYYYLLSFFSHNSILIVLLTIISPTVTISSWSNQGRADYTEITNGAKREISNQFSESAACALEEGEDQCVRSERQYVDLPFAFNSVRLHLLRFSHTECPPSVASDSVSPRAKKLSRAVGSP